MQGKVKKITLNVKTYDLLSGTAQEVSGWEELESLLWEVQLLYGALKNDKFFTKNDLKEKMKELKNGYGNPKPRHLALLETDFGTLLSITIENDEDNEPYDLNNKNGVFSYVWNITDDWCSEYGYTFYENNIRVG